MRSFPWIVLSGAVAGCASVDDRLRSVWPDYRDAIRVVRDGRADPEGLRVVSESQLTPWDGLELEYRGAGPLVVRERIRAKAGRAWTRVFTVEGLESGCEVFVLVPHEDREGRALGIATHGETVPREPGRLETEIPLSRDGPIVIELRPWKGAG